MRVTRFASFFAIAALATATLVAGRLSAATIFSDDFESGSMSNWTQTSATAGTSLVNSTAQNVVPAIWSDDTGCKKENSPPQITNQIT